MFNFPPDIGYRLIFRYVISDLKPIALLCDPNTIFQCAFIYRHPLVVVPLPIQGTCFIGFIIQAYPGKYKFYIFSVYQWNGKYNPFRN
jgi:hypothetical protein